MSSCMSFTHVIMHQLHHACHDWHHAAVIHTTLCMSSRLYIITPVITHVITYVITHVITRIYHHVCHHLCHHACHHACHHLCHHVCHQTCHHAYNMSYAIARVIIIASHKYISWPQFYTNISIWILYQINPDFFRSSLLSILTSSYPDFSWFWLLLIMTSLDLQFFRDPDYSLSWIPPILTSSYPDFFLSWLLPLLTSFSPDFFLSWLLPILIFPDSDIFRFWLISILASSEEVRIADILQILASNILIWSKNSLKLRKHVERLFKITSRFNSSTSCSYRFPIFVPTFGFKATSTGRSIDPEQPPRICLLHGNFSNSVRISDVSGRYPSLPSWNW